MSKIRHLLLQMLKDSNDTELLSWSEQSLVEFVDKKEELEAQYPYLLILNRSSDLSNIIPMVFISTVPQYVMTSDDDIVQVVPKECILYATGQKIYANSLGGLGGSLSLGMNNGYMYYNYNVKRTNDRFLWCNYDLYYWEGTAPTTKIYRKKG